MNSQQYPSQPHRSGFPYGPGNNQGGSPYNMSQGGNAGHLPYGGQASGGQSPYNYPGQPNYNTGPQGAYGFGSQPTGGYGPGQPSPAGSDGGNGGNKRNNIIIGISAAVVVIALVAVGIILASNSSGDNEGADTSAASTTSSADPATSSSATSPSSSTTPTSTTATATVNLDGLIDSDGYFNPCKADENTLTYLDIAYAADIKKSDLTDNDQSGCMMQRVGTGQQINYYALKGRPRAAKDAKTPSGLPKGWVYSQSTTNSSNYHYMKELKTGWAFISTRDSAAGISTFMDNLEKILVELGQTSN